MSIYKISLSSLLYKKRYLRAFISKQNHQIHKFQVMEKQSHHRSQSQVMERFTNFFLIYKFQSKSFGRNQFFVLQIFPFQPKGQLLKVKNPTLRSDLNRLILQLNGRISIPGIKFKLNPVSGVFFLQFSCLQSCNFSKQKDFQHKILQKYKENSGIRSKFVNILNLISERTSLPKKQIQKEQILKLGYNSSFYGWNMRQLKVNLKTRKVKKQIQMWSDTDSNDQSTTNERELSQNSQICSSPSDKMQDQNKSTYFQVQFSEFYNKSRKKYDQLCFIPGRSLPTQNEFFEIQEQYISLIKNMFISKGQDIKLYQKYLKKYQNHQIQSNVNLQIQPSNIERPKTNIQRIKSNDQRFSSSKQQSKQTAERQDQSKNLCKSVFLCWDKNLERQPETEEQIMHVKLFFERNILSISKTSKWRIIIGIIQLVSNDFTKNLSKRETFSIQNNLLKLQKRFSLSLMQKKETSVLNPFISNHLGHFSNKSQKQNQNDQLSDDFQEIGQSYEKSKGQSYERAQAEQKKLGAVLLTFICTLIFPKKMLIDKNNENDLKVFDQKHLKMGDIFRWTQEYYQHLKDLNLQIEGVLLYLHKRAKTSEKSPFADWVTILSEHINQVIQQNQIL